VNDLDRDGLIGDDAPRGHPPVELDGTPGVARVFKHLGARWPLDRAADLTANSDDPHGSQPADLLDYSPTRTTLKTSWDRSHTQHVTGTRWQDHTKYH
jgi:hypothetical protein